MKFNSKTMWCIVGIIACIMALYVIFALWFGFRWNPIDGIYWNAAFSWNYDIQPQPTYTYTNLTLRDILDVMFYHGEHLIR